MDLQCIVHEIALKYFNWCQCVGYSKIFVHTHFMKQVLKELISFIFRNGFIQDAAKNAVIALINGNYVDLQNNAALFFFSFSGKQLDFN